MHNAPLLTSSPKKSLPSKAINPPKARNLPRKAKTSVPNFIDNSCSEKLSTKTGEEEVTQTGEAEETQAGEAKETQAGEAEETQAGEAEETQAGEEQGRALKARNLTRTAKSSVNFIDAFCAGELSDLDDSVVDKTFVPDLEKTLVEDDEFSFSPVHPTTLEMIREAEEEEETVEDRGGGNVEAAASTQCGTSTSARSLYDPHPSLTKIAEGVYEVPGRNMPMLVKPHMNICTGDKSFNHGRDNLKMLSNKSLVCSSWLQLVHNLRS